MTAADQLRAEGRLEGRREERREILLELLEVRFGPVDPALRARIEQAPLEQLGAWTRRFVVASTREEVFEG